MSDHDLLTSLNILRSIILLVGIVGLLTYQRVDKRLVLSVALVLLVLNLCGLAIATFLVNHDHS